MTDFILYMALFGYAALNSACGSGHVYFPPGVFAEHFAYDQAGAETAMEYLVAFDEKPLYPASKSTEAYRFLWLRGFDPAIVVRVTRSKGNVLIKVGQLPGTSPQQRPEIRQREGTEEEWRSLQQALAAADFWNSLQSKPVPAGEVVIDGSRWIIEGVDQGDYRIVQRIFPREPDRLFIDLGMEFLRLSGVDLANEDVY